MASRSSDLPLAIVAGDLVLIQARLIRVLTPYVRVLAGAHDTAAYLPPYMDMPADVRPHMAPHMAPRMAPRMAPYTAPRTPPTVPLAVDFIFLVIRSGAADGVQRVRAVAASKASAVLVVVMAHTDESLRRTFRNAGADHCFDAAFEFNDLYAALPALMGRRAAPPDGVAG